MKKKLIIVLIIFLIYITIRFLFYYTLFDVPLFLGTDTYCGGDKYDFPKCIVNPLKTKSVKTLVINYDMQLPRPYSNRWLLQGTKGVYDEEKKSIYLVDQSPDYHQWEAWKPYEEKYNHKWWKADYSSQSHGGTDYVMLSAFIDAVRVKGSTPIDVYDSAVMTAIVELSGLSIEKGASVPFPDFTKGKWQTNKPYFALDM
jgi:hypothetical protein